MSEHRYLTFSIGVAALAMLPAGNSLAQTPVATPDWTFAGNVGLFSR
jgi:hypothetical protein